MQETIATMSLSYLQSSSPKFSETFTTHTHTPHLPLSPPPQMVSLDEQVAQALNTITMLSNNMTSMQWDISILMQQVVMNQQPVTSQPIQLPSSINIPLPQSPPQQPPSLYFFPPAMFTSPPTHTKEPKIMALIPFTGKHEDTKLFINSCTLYMNGQKSEFADEDANIYWILSYTYDCRICKNLVQLHNLLNVLQTADFLKQQ